MQRSAITLGRRPNKIFAMRGTPVLRPRKLRGTLEVKRLQSQVTEMRQRLLVAEVKITEILNKLT